MASVITLSLLLAVLVRTKLTDLVIRKEGKEYIFDIVNNPDYCLLFRNSAEENPMLFNTSNSTPEISTLAALFRSRLELIKDQDREPYIQIVSLIPSDSGQYRLECWRNHSVTNKDTNLLVCSGYFKKEMYVDIGDTVDLRCDGTRDDETMTVQWYRRYDSEKLMPEKSSSLHVNVSMVNRQSETNSSLYLYSLYTCVLLEEQHCVSYHSFYLYIKPHHLVVSVGEKAELYCFNPDDPNGTKTQWVHKMVRVFTWEPNPLTRSKNQYVTDGRRSGNYSLLIPSLMLRHSGSYVCMKKNDKHIIIERYSLLVCPKSETEPLIEFFLEWNQVVVKCNSNITNSDWVVWYRRTARLEHVFWSTSYNEPYVVEDLYGRIKASNDGSILVLSNLSLKDTGEYGCAVFYREECVSVTKTLLLKWEPFGINSTFYRVYSTLMGCALLGMVCALITVNLKIRRRDQEDLNL